MAAIWRIRDRLGREVVLTEMRWQHMRYRHQDMAQRLADVRAVIENPDVVTVDADFGHRQNSYRRFGTSRLFVKVVVHYRPVPPQGMRVGEVITAYTTQRIAAKENALWP